MISFTVDDIAEVVHKCFSDQMQETSKTLFTEQLESFRNPFVQSTCKTSTIMNILTYW